MSECCLETAWWKESNKYVINTTSVAKYKSKIHKTFLVTVHWSSLKGQACLYMRSWTQCKCSRYAVYVIRLVWASEVKFLFRDAERSHIFLHVAFSNDQCIGYDRVLKMWWQYSRCCCNKTPSKAGQNQDSFYPHFIQNLLFKKKKKSAMQYTLSTLNAIQFAQHTLAIKYTTYAC